MTIAFSAMSTNEAAVFMNGKENHPIRDVTAGIIRDEYVLDVGCGRGIRIKELYDPNQYCGIDPSIALIERARRDNPDHLFLHVNEHQICRFIEHCGRVQNILISSVFEHMASLEKARELYDTAIEYADRVVIGWNHPPHYETTEIIRVQAELRIPIHQNHYAEGSFDRSGVEIEITPVDATSEVWSVNKI